ncbi:MAG TPA: DUF1385 domain-containing protein [Firmicutes bacterium]|nr:DUF1385 domain-containing protein [Bacillota bacterium]
MEPKKPIGGQAVIEGVMMRGPGGIATAVRQPNQEITVKKDQIHSLQERWPFLKLPILRGVVTLFESLVYGVKALNFSAQAAGEEDEQLTNKELAVTMVVALVAGIILFIIIPTAAAKLVKGLTTDPFWFNLAEGFIRMAVFLLYIFAISRMSDIQRVFQYHGAEHKVIHAYEADEPLTADNIRKFSRLHPRCGTNFLLIVMLVSIFVFSFLGWPVLWLRILSRIVLMPLIAGVSYEIIRVAGKHKGGLVHACILPGLWLQYLTTREPDDDQIEVAVRALQEVKEEKREV